MRPYELTFLGSPVRLFITGNLSFSGENQTKNYRGSIRFAVLAILCAADLGMSAEKSFRERIVVAEFPRCRVDARLLLFQD
jgi:hypothetical protein